MLKVPPELEASANRFPPTNRRVTPVGEAPALIDPPVVFPIDAVKLPPTAQFRSPPRAWIFNAQEIFVAVKSPPTKRFTLTGVAPTADLKPIPKVLPDRTGADKVAFPQTETFRFPVKTAVRTASI